MKRSMAVLNWPIVRFWKCLGLRRELLDHVIVLNQTHLDRLPRKYIDEYYHVARPHQGLDRNTPSPQEKPTLPAGPTKLKSIPILGGLYHRCVRVAA